MNKILIVTVLLVIMLGCDQKEKQASDPKNHLTDTICISGMVCDGCAQTIGKKLKDQKGVLSQKVTYKDSIAVITYDKSQIDQEKLVEVVKETGYMVVKCDK